MALFFYFIPEEHREKADNYTMDVTWNPRDPRANTIRFFLDKFAKQKGIVQADRLKMALLGFKTHGMVLDDDSTLDELMEYMNDKSHNLKVFVLQLSEIEAKTAQHPNSVVFIAKTLYKEKPLTFSKVVFMLADDSSTVLYERVFKKFAHFYRSQFEYAGQDYPATVVDYDKLFFERIADVPLEKQDFKLLVDDEPLEKTFTPEAKVTITHIYQAYLKRLRERDVSDQYSRSPFKKKPITVLADIKFEDGALSGIDFSMTLKTTAHHEQVSIMSEIRPNLSQALDDYFSEEDLPDAEKVECTKCKRRTTSSKKLCLEKLPKYLIIHMKKLKLRAYDPN